MLIDNIIAEMRDLKISWTLLGGFESEAKV